MIREEDGALTGYIYIDLKNSDYGGFFAGTDKPRRRQTRKCARITIRREG
jgi:Cu(I)/Ag(I) efflux system membrane protein CusA/SilA